MEDKVFLMPRIGDMAPDFEAVTTTGKLKFSEYNKGSWDVFFSHPADFTPVCTTEMSGFANEKEFIFNPINTGYILQEKDILIVIGYKQSLKDLKTDFLSKFF